MVRALLSARLLALHVLGAVATTAAVLLGLWQYDAWQAARELAARDLVDTPARPLTAVLGPDEPLTGDDVGRPVSFTGGWLPEGSFLVRGKELAGRTGFWVVTPARVCVDAPPCPGAAAMLVVRGWVGAADPVPAAPRGPVEVTGWLQPPEGRGLPDPDPADDVLAELRVAAAVQRVDADLYSGFVIARELRPAAATAGLDAVPPGSLPRPGTGTALRNLLYALEWWVFAGFAAFLWGRWVLDELARARAAGRAGAEEPATEETPAAEIPSSP